jgi:cation:H+ antiporter
VALAAAGVRPRAPLTPLAASLVLVLEGVLVIAVLAVVVMGTQLPADLSFARLDPASLAITAIWIIGLILLLRAGRGLLIGRRQLPVLGNACPSRPGDQRPPPA